MRDALNRDRRMAIALLQPGWESDYYGNHPVHEVCCVGHIENFEELEEGKFNLLLVGEQKIRIQSASPTDKPYRTVAGIPLLDRAPRGTKVVSDLHQQLLELAVDYFKLRSTGELDLSGIQVLGYEVLVNSLAAHLGFPAEHKQQLLEIDDIQARGKQVARFLQVQIHEQSVVRKFQHLTPKDPTLN